MVKGHTKLPSLVSSEYYYLINATFLSSLGDLSP